MGMNVAEKILARASGLRDVAPRQIIEARVDVAMFHDLTGPLTVKSFREMGGDKVWDPNRVVVVFDHLIPADTLRTAGLHKSLRQFVQEQNITHFYDVGRGGVCHQVTVEKGYARPGELIIGADSHTCTYGAVGAFASGVGATDMAAVLVTGRTWLKVPETVRLQLEGRLDPLVSAKDVVLYIIGQLRADGATYKAVLFTGPVISRMSVDGRMTICNMAVEMGAKAGIVEPDEVTLQYLKGRTNAPFTPLLSDPDADYTEEYVYDLLSLEPQVACPHSVENVKPVSEIGDVPIDQALIGSCTNGRLEDLRAAALVMKGRKVKENVRALVIPASQEVYMAALREGLLETFTEAGALVCNANCGPCLGGHMGILADGEVCISSTNRNFVGRMGSTKAYVYLASPATVAASAITGKITDPRLVKG
ncbi:MAG: 3-isopropylmalate dehydratase large subunit [Candidatus Bathyarchaeia archaeon]